MELLEELEGDGKKKEGPSLVVFLAVCAVITLIAGGAGFGVGATMLTPVTMAPAAETPAAAGEDDKAADSHGEPAAHGDAEGHGAAADANVNLAVVDIPAITTNLFDPPDAWIRMELSLAFEDEADSEIADEIHQDILAYVHTMKLYNLRGGSGYQHLLEDLNERASIRSEGRVKRVFVRSFILE